MKTGLHPISKEHPLLHAQPILFATLAGRSAVAIKIFPLNFVGGSKCVTISAYNLKIVEKDQFLRHQMRAKEDFNRHQLYSTNKQYVKIKLMQNEKIIGVFFGKDEILVKL